MNLGEIHIDKHQLSAAHGPVKTPKPLNLDFQNSSRLKPQTEARKKENRLTPGDGDIDCTTRSSTQPPQPKGPDINNPCACRPNSHPQTTRDSEKYSDHIDPHPSQGLCDEVLISKRANKVPGYLKSSHPDHRHRKTTTTSTTPMRPRTPAGPAATTPASRNHDGPAKSYAPIPNPKEPINLERPQQE